MKKLILSMFMLFLTFLAFSESRTYYGYRYSFSTYDDEPDLTFVYKNTCDFDTGLAQEYAIVYKKILPVSEINSCIDKLKQMTDENFSLLQESAFDKAKKLYDSEWLKSVFYVWNENF